MTVRCKGVARWLSGGKRPSHPIFHLSKKGVGIIEEERTYYCNRDLPIPDQEFEMELEN